MVADSHRSNGVCGNNDTNLVEMSGFIHVRGKDL